MKLWRTDDLMTRDVVSVRMDMPYGGIVDVLLSRRVSAVPVVDDGGRTVGIVSESDLLLKVSDGSAAKIVATSRRRRGMAKADGRLAADLMTSPVVHILPSSSLSAAARLMRQRNVRRLVVQDNLGRLVGIVSQGDLLKIYSRPDEELRHDVDQEILHQGLTAERESVRVSVLDGVVRLSGHLQLRSSADRIARVPAGVPGVVDAIDRITFDIDDRMALRSSTAAPFGVA